MACRGHRLLPKGKVIRYPWQRAVSRSIKVYHHPRSCDGLHCWTTDTGWQSISNCRSQAGGNKGSLDNGFESQSLAVSSRHRGHQAAFQNARKVISTPHAQQEVFILSGTAKEGAWWGCHLVSFQNKKNIVVGEGPDETRSFCSNKMEKGSVSFPK